MRNIEAKIIVENKDELNVAASSARISTQQGTALEIYEKSGNYERDMDLIRKVMASGHKSVIEHQTFSVAFNDISVFAEQFIIEFRMASYTVKSRRYVDFSSVGYVVPEDLTDAQRVDYCTQMEYCFDAYQSLLELGISKEDARFVLPYCFRSNFYMTTNARELIHMICAMLYGRGAKYPELRKIGTQLKAQMDALYPGAVDSEIERYGAVEPEIMPTTFRSGTNQTAHCEIISAPPSPEALLEKAMAFSGRFLNGQAIHSDSVHALIGDQRPRELEMLTYVFEIKNISLACLTHITRHRIQSPIIPSVIRALASGNYVLPESVAANAQAEKIYREAFAAQTVAAQKAQASGLQAETLVYYAMSGHVMDIMMAMNARELLHFSKLRSCTRAQWEICNLTREMIHKLASRTPLIFSHYGPSCAVTGKCPEGKMTCGRPVHIEDGEWKVQG